MADDRDEVERTTVVETGGGGGGGGVLAVVLLIIVILVLLFVTFAVQGAFVGFFLYLRKRAKLIAEIDLDNEWSELQGGATRT